MAKDFVLVYAKDLAVGDTFRRGDITLEAKDVEQVTESCSACGNAVAKVNVSISGGYLTLLRDQSLEVVAGPTWNLKVDNDRRREMGLIDRHMTP